MKLRLRFDSALKEFFEQQRPTLLMDLTGGIQVKEPLNVELPRVQERKADLVLLLADNSLLHVEFQSVNHSDMALRMAEYYLLLWRRHRRPIRQAVLYVGLPRLRMVSSMEHPAMQFRYALHDIREWPALRMLDSGRTADQVLAILAGGVEGNRLVHEILLRLSRKGTEERDRALAYLAALSGLRRFETILEQEAERMSVVIDVKKNPILWRSHEEAREEGREEGREEALRFAIRTTLEARFGPLPRWAEQRLRRATTAQITSWLAKGASAERLDSAIPRG